MRSSRTSSSVLIALGVVVSTAVAACGASAGSTGSTGSTSSITASSATASSASASGAAAGVVSAVASAPASGTASMDMSAAASSPAAATLGSSDAPGTTTRPHPVATSPRSPVPAPATTKPLTTHKPPTTRPPTTRPAPTTTKAPTTTTPAPATTTPAPPTTTKPPTTRPSVGTVTANEAEFSIALSRGSLAAGRYVFVVHNRGTMTHALEIDGPGVSASTDDIAQGATASLTVTLRPGSYDIFCPIADHKSLGMDVHVTVS